MTDVTVLAEGKSELRFAKSPMADHLGSLAVFVHPIAVLTSKDNRRSIQFRGGVLSYSQVKADLLRIVKRDFHKPNAWVTTMVDLYHLPDDFPGYAHASSMKNPHERVAFLETEFGEDIGFERFIPYIELHEFEALIFANPTALSEYYSEPHHTAGIDSLVKARRDFANAELVNDGAKTAPSKRIITAIPQYKSEKATAGPLVANKIGLPQLRRECPHFHQWMERLEALGNHS